MKRIVCSLLWDMKSLFREVIYALVRDN
jgi:hypothetical protein